MAFHRRFLLSGVALTALTMAAASFAINTPGDIAAAAAQIKG